MPAPANAQLGSYKPPLAEPEPLWARSERSDATGSFRFEGLPAGLLRVAVLGAGFERRDEIVVAALVASAVAASINLGVSVSTPPRRLSLLSLPLLSSPPAPSARR